MNDYIKAIILIVILYPLCYLAAFKMALHDLKQMFLSAADSAKEKGLSEKPAQEPLTGSCPFEQNVIDACRRDGMSDEDIRTWLKQL